MTAQPDRAVRTFDEDNLDRKPFIDRLVRSLIDKKSGRATGIVVGIVGEWGSGKTSILNMLHGAIRAAYPEHALIIRFDPWLVSGRDDLIQQFFRQLIANIPDGGGQNEKLKELKNGFLKYGKNIKGVAGIVGAFVPGADKAIEALHDYLNSGEDIHALREELHDLLKAIEVPLVVLIDELDRVDDGEVHTVAQLVRSVMDFPSISYVLAYDDRRVADALGRGDVERGQAYLEKIVQFPIPLPLATGSEIRRMFEAQLMPIIEDIGIDPELFGRQRYKELIEILISGTLRTPRDIKRVLGAHSDAKRPVIPIQNGHRLRFNPATYSDPKRPVRLGP